MKISFIVPIYNVEKYLKKCIDSIINQSYNNLEILLIDDGSTDNCPILCDEYAKKDKRIKVIHQKNQGLSNARNNGIKLSTGDFIWFVDGDDYIEENSIQQFLPYLENNDILVFHYNNIKNNKTIKLKSFYNYKEIDIKYLLSHCMAWNKIFKKEILTNDFFPENHIYEDLYSIPPLILKTKKIKFLDMYLYNYVCRNNSIKKISNKTSDRIYALNNLYSQLNKKYKEEIEYLFIYNLLITSLIEETTNKCKYNFYDLNKFVKEKYPNYCKNKYWKQFSIMKQIYLYLLYYNIFFIPRIITYFKMKKDFYG